MYQKDYILRLIEEASKVILEILNLKKNEKHKEAVMLIKQGFSNLLDIDVKKILNVETENLINYLTKTKGLDSQKIKISVDLLLEYYDYAKPKEKRIVLLHANLLLNYIDQKESTFSFDRIHKKEFINHELIKL
jgi:phosphoenolpyruvate synthase/pyruvate phosphate dikinase